MNKTKAICIVVCLLAVLFVVSSVNADLNLLGQGTSTHGTYNLIYDTDLDVTWYDYSSSRDSWQNQLDWADALSVTFESNTYSDWRLPTTVDGPYVWGYDGTTTAGYNITSSEMGHLYYTELGNPGYYDISGNTQTDLDFIGLINTGDFQNLQPLDYWSGTEYAADTSDAWEVDFGLGAQYNFPQIYDFHAIAVRSGLAVVPEPISSILFFTGGGVLAGRRYLRRRK